MRIWSLERAVVSLGAGAAVVAQGLLESLFPAPAIRCAFGRDYARAVTAAGVSGQPCDEWLEEEDVDEVEEGYVPICCRPGGRCRPPEEASAARCDNCGWVIGDVGYGSKVATGHFCSLACMKEAEAVQSSPVAPTGEPSSVTTNTSTDDQEESGSPPGPLSSDSLLNEADSLLLRNAACGISSWLDGQLCRDTEYWTSVFGRLMDLARK